MLGKILYEKYHNSGGSRPSFHLEVITENFFVDCMNSNGLFEGYNGISSLVFVSKNPDGGFREEVDYEGRRVVMIKRVLLDKEGIPQKQSKTPPTEKGPEESNCLFVNFKSTKDPKYSLEDSVRRPLLKEVRARTKEFQNSILQRYKPQHLEALNSHPINPSVFFNDCKSGLGPVFEEIFYLKEFHSCCDPSFTAKGFIVSAVTSNFQIDFSYTQNADFHDGRSFGGFWIGKSNMGLEVKIDNDYSIKSIQETGTDNTLVGLYHHDKSLKSGRGLSLKLYLEPFIQKLRSVLKLDERVVLCESFADKDFKAAVSKLQDMHKFGDAYNKARFNTFLEKMQSYS